MYKKNKMKRKSQKLEINWNKLPDTSKITFVFSKSFSFFVCYLIIILQLTCTFTLSLKIQCIKLKLFYNIHVVP